MSRSAGDDRRREIVTPEGLALSLTLASRGTRAGALALDLMLMLLAAGATLAVLGEVFGGLSDARTADSGPAQLLFVVLVISAFVLRNGWFLLWELGPRGATPAKRLLGIRVVGREGARLTPEMVIARNLLRDIELALPIVFVAMAPTGAAGTAGWLAAAWFLLFAAFPLFNRDRMRAGDVIAGTWVVETGRQKLAAALTVGEAGDGGRYAFGEAELAIYGEHELKTLERVLRDGRAEVMDEVAAAICAKIGWTPPGRDAARAFLEAYYRALRARLESGLRFGRRKADKHAA
ncbi:MAG: RDD family protein [Sphingomonadales bacterium]|nr:RDD family protein [Sphingomonadales bacterium]